MHLLLGYLHLQGSYTYHSTERLHLSCGHAFPEHPVIPWPDVYGQRDGFQRCKYRTNQTAVVISLVHSSSSDIYLQFCTTGGGNSNSGVCHYEDPSDPGIEQDVDCGRLTPVREASCRLSRWGR
jgi:hypothetical protein